MTAPQIMPMRLSELHPAEYNPRLDVRTDKHFYNSLNRSLTKFGQVDPILYWVKDKKIIGGTQRYYTLLQEGVDEGWTIILGDIGWWFKDTDISLKTEGEVKALNIALNKITGEFIDEKLVDLIEQIKTAQVDVTLTGYSDKEISLMLRKHIGGDPGEDKVPEPPKKPHSRHGDIYLLGRHRIMCGDCTKDEDMTVLMNGNKADMVFTDPPYNLGFNGTVNNQFEVLMNDNLSEGEYNDFTFEWLDKTIQHSNSTAAYYVCIDWRRYPIIASNLESEKHLKIHNVIVWDKVFAGMGQKYRYRHEFIVFAGGEGMQWYGSTQDEDVIKIAKADKRSERILDMKGLSLKVARGYVRIKREQTNPSRVPVVGGGSADLIFTVQEDSDTDVWESFSMNYFQQRNKEASDGIVHPTMKPIALIEVALTNSSRPRNDIILDPFLGSGSTLIACEKTGRTCYGMELDPKYVDQVVHRWEAFTGNKAELKRGSK